MKLSREIGRENRKSEALELSGPRRSIFDSRRVIVAFTLLEVMIAIAIFFMATFTILALVSSTLRNARALQGVNVDAGMLAAQLSLTNKLYEGSDSGDFEDLYKDYRWTREVYEVSTNGLFRADFTVLHRVGQRDVESHMSVLFFRPESPAGSPFGGGFRR